MTVSGEESHWAPGTGSVTPRRSLFVGAVVDGVAVITLDQPGSSVNTLQEGFLAEFENVLGAIEADPQVHAVVLRSGKDEGFHAGAHVESLMAVRFAAEAERRCRQLAHLFDRVARCPKPFVAAVHGAALGAGFELALACRAIVLSDDPASVVGFPEVKLGLIPGANGLLRVAERAGLECALELGLTGQPIGPALAKAQGLVDEVCPVSMLDAVARGLAKSRGHGRNRTARLVRPWELDPRALRAMALEDNRVGRRFLFKKAREHTLRKTLGFYPAAERVIEVLECYATQGHAQAAALEARRFGELVVSEASHRLVELFLASTALKKDTGVEGSGVVSKVALAPKVPASVGVIGGGLMGGGIAYVTVDAKIPVRLKELDDGGVGRTLHHVKGLLDERVARQEISPRQGDDTFARLSGTTSLCGLKFADIVLESVFENLALKQAVLREVEAVTQPSCIYATTTSSIPIARIAEVSTRPDRVLGMHYFSPVHRMPLLEVVRTASTADEALASAVALGKRQGKTVIVVRDGVGFYTSRIIAPYINEASYLLVEGVPVEAIDRALMAWGFPVGPLQLLDEVGIDVAAHVGESLVAAFGDRFRAPSVSARLKTSGRKGRKNGKGFYRYDDKAFRDGQRRVDETIYEDLGLEPRARVPVEEIQTRCALQFVNEAVACLGEGVLRSPRDGDVGAVLGLGFPAFRGGPFRYVDTVGAAEVLRRMQSYRDRFGRRFTAAPLLVEMARKGERFFP